MNQDVPYSNREIDHHFKELKETLARIETQVMKTNGRVTRLEMWKQWIAGIFVLGGVCSALVVYIYTKEINGLNDMIKMHIEEVKLTLKK